MSVLTEASRSNYVGDGATAAFNTGFYFLEASDLVVKLTPSGGTEVVQTLGVHYSVTMPAGVGLNGTVTMLVAPPVSSGLVIERTVPFIQDTSFRTSGSFSASRHEDAMDETVFQTQQLARRLKDLESAGPLGSVVAGNGLAFSGSTLHVGAGAGIQSNADTVEVAFGEAGDLAAIYADPGVAGVADFAARIDHTHRVSTAKPSSIAVGDSATEGGDVNLARADHVHGVLSGVPVNVTKAAAAEGVSTAFARADHKHDITTAAVVDITDAANAEGTAASLARSDHTHSHGARGGGTLHAVAISGGAAGFMTGADKAAVDAIGAVALKTHVHAYQGAPQSMPNGIAGTTIIFGTEDYDADAEYNPATGIFTAKAAGYVLVELNYALASAAWLAGAGAAALYLVRNNGADVVEATDYDIVDANVSKPTYLHISKVVKVAVGETVRALLGHSQGGAVNSLGARSSCSMTIDRII
ncbi:MAG: hypothetical protein Q8K32_09305 [Archangium sp.]|nr:hypothetical protein [Archangium sp.]